MYIVQESITTLSYYHALRAMSTHSAIPEKKHIAQSVAMITIMALKFRSEQTDTGHPDDAQDWGEVWMNRFLSLATFSFIYIFLEKFSYLHPMKRTNYKEPQNSWEVSFIMATYYPKVHTGLSFQEAYHAVGFERSGELRQWAMEELKQNKSWKYWLKEHTMPKQR